MDIFGFLPDELIWACIPVCDSLSELLRMRLISKRFNEILTSDDYWKTFSNNNYRYLLSLLVECWPSVVLLDRSFFEIKNRLAWFLRVEEIPLKIRRVYGLRVDFNFRLILRELLSRRIKLIEEKIRREKNERARYLKRGFHMWKGKRGLSRYSRRWDRFPDSPEEIELNIRNLENQMQVIRNYPVGE